MATRSHVGIVNQDGSVERIYVHWDGYPKGNGKILQEHYTKERKVRELLNHGRVSELSEDIEHTKFAGRDIGRTDGIAVVKYRSVEEMLDDIHPLQIEWVYLFRPDGSGGGMWSCIHTMKERTERPLAEVIAEETVKGK